MPFVSTKSLSINSAEEFINAVANPGMNVSLYIAIAKVTPWANDSNPDTPIDNVDNKVNFWRNMIGGKQINDYNMSLALPRINWTANTVYTPYRNSGNTIFGTSFYVLTSDFNVYKCIDNANNSPSTVQPTYTEYNRTITQGDGYTWKFMYSLNSSDRNRFLTDEWMPVRTLSLNNGSIQWLVQENAVNGGIEFVLDKTPGANYNANVMVTVTGDGINANVQATTNLTSQTISSVVSVSPGSGYHFANLQILPLANNNPGTGATATAIIDPFGGHGSDPVEELGGSNVIISVQLKGNEGGDITINNEYRQIGILKNPLTYATQTVYSNTDFSQTTDINVSLGGGSYALNEYVFQGGSLANATFSGVVVDWDSGNNIITLNQTNGAPTAGSLIGANTGTTRYIINISSNPNLVPYSGQILYIDNITPIQRASDQTEQIQIVLSF